MVHHTPREEEKKKGEGKKKRTVPLEQIRVERRGK